MHYFSVVDDPISDCLIVTNTFNSAFLPISAYYSYDNTGAPYDASAVVTDGKFDLEKYRSYSPLFISSTLAIEYGLAFAAFPALIVHTLRRSCYLSNFFLHTDRIQSLVQARYR